MRSNEKNYKSLLINIILGICVTLFSISTSVMLVLNLTPIYKNAIDKFELVKYTGVSAEKLMINYKGMINYLGNPFIEELSFNDFTMSLSGQIHFEEVKDIFMNLYIIMAMSILIIIISKLIKKISKYINLIKVLNYCSNITLSLFGFIITMIFVDFSKAFVIFHNIFFDNSYWIFDPVTDPIINALPEELFMTYAIIIVILLIMQSVLFKYIYYKNRSNN